MNCPKCNGVLGPKTQGEISVHQCSRCFGLWCAPSELAKMKQAYLSEIEIDTGDPARGKEYNPLKDISCPVCMSAMDNVADEQQKHIEYEACPQGHGVFLDAGEFTDLKHKTFTDLVKVWFRRRS